MEIYKYNVDRTYKESYAEYSSIMVGKTMPNIAHGYVFVDDYDEAIRTLESKYPSNMYVRYDIHLERTNIIET